MHELGLCASVVDAVRRRAGDRSVSRLRVRVGALQHVHPEAFEQSFALAAEGTVAAGARAELVLVPLRARCGRCAGTWESMQLPSGCPYCGAVELEIAGGDEVILESIEYSSEP